MSIHTHLAALERRHQALERQISGEQMHPSCDDLRIAQLERLKLLVRDEIAYLQQGVRALASRARSSPPQNRKAAVRMTKLKSSSWYEGATRAIAIVKEKSL